MPIGDAPRALAGSITDGSYGTLALDLYESVPALVWPASHQTYSKMRRDTQIKAVLGAYTLPIMAATFEINPRGCRDEVVQLCADAWGLPIAGSNDGPGPARRRGVQWDDHLRIAISTMLTYGYAPFAYAGEVVGSPQRWRLTELSERLPVTITDIQTNDDGSLKGIVQAGSKTLIPASQLLWYVLNREGAQWQGQSMIREAYAPWLIKHEMWRVLAQSSRRFGMGIMEVKAPSGGTQADVNRAAEIAAGYRAGDQAGLGLPDGFTSALKGLSGSVPDTLGFVRYLDQQIAQSVMASVLNLDASPNGSRALGGTMLSLLELSWKATAKAITGPATGLNIRMVDYNFGEDEPVPAVLCTDISRPEVTSEAIASLVTCGALTPDLGLENDLRNRYQLPVIGERPEPEQQTAPEGDVEDAPTTLPGTTGRTNEPAPAAVAVR